MIISNALDFLLALSEIKISPVADFKIVNRVSLENFNDLSDDEKEGFNCGGFALGTKRWESFFTWNSDPFYDTENDKKRYHKKGKIGYKMFRELSKRYPGLIKKYNSFNDALNNKKNNEEIVAFRLSDNDFHFKLYCENIKQWVEKMGHSTFLEYDDKNNIYQNWNSFNENYDGPIIFFTVKKREL